MASPGSRCVLYGLLFLNIASAREGACLHTHQLISSNWGLQCARECNEKSLRTSCRCVQASQFPMQIPAQNARLCAHGTHLLGSVIHARTNTHAVRLRGGSEALHSRDFDPVDKRLADLEMLFSKVCLFLWLLDFLKLLFIPNIYSGFF